MATIPVAEKSAAAAGVSPIGRRFYAPELDLLRFFAFLLVFMRHVVTGFGIAKKSVDSHAGTALAHAAFAGGSDRWALIQSMAQSFDFGVCLFFFLSSYLITTLLMIEKDSTGYVDVGAFYVRRSVRIWPLYFVFLALMGTLSLSQTWMNITTGRMLASLTFVANWPVVLHGWVGSPIEPLWSVSVEEQFYMVWPQFAQFGMRGIRMISVVLAAVPFAVLWMVGSRAECQNTTFWANSFVQCLFFAGGALTASALKGRAPEYSAWLRILCFLGGVGCWLVASAGFHVVRTVSPSVFNLSAGYILVLAGTALIFLAFLGWKPTGVPNVFCYLGKISYGLYVFHFFWLQVLTLSIGGNESGILARAPLLLQHSIIGCLALCCTIACAAISYRFLESPFLQFKKRFTIVASR